MEGSHLWLELCHPVAVFTTAPRGRCTSSGERTRHCWNHAYTAVTIEIYVFGLPSGGCDCGGCVRCDYGGCGSGSDHAVRSTCRACDNNDTVPCAY